MACEYCNTVTGDGSLKAFILSDYIDCSHSDDSDETIYHEVDIVITPDAELAVYVDGSYTSNANMAVERINFCPKCGEKLTLPWKDDA